MTISIEVATEWAAAALRPTARWVPVTSADGRTRMQMAWALPAVEVPRVAPAA